MSDPIFSAEMRQKIADAVTKITLETIAKFEQKRSSVPPSSGGDVFPLLSAAEAAHHAIDPERAQGLNQQKYRVTRTDGSSESGGKHAQCSYYVLDLTHDRFGLLRGEIDPVG